MHASATNFTNSKWKRVDSGAMEAAPFLLNPDDRVWQTVYLTAPIKNRSQVPDFTNMRETSSLIVTARIVNLKDFTKAKSFMEERSLRKSALVYLSFMDVLFLLFVASLTLYWYARALERSGFAKFPSRRAFVLIVLLGILSYSTAEVITFYLFGGDPSYEAVFGRNLFDWRYQVQNWVVLLVHVVCSVYLYRRAKRPLAIS